MVELEEPRVIPSTLEEGVLERTHSQTSIASGLSQGARIGLYLLKHDSQIQASVFTYPLTLILTPKKIESLDPAFSDILQREISREFKDLSVEDLNQSFLKSVKPLIPFMSHNYTSQKLQIKEHSFNFQALRYIRDTIYDLKP